MIAQIVVRDAGLSVDIGNKGIQLVFRDVCAAECGAEPQFGGLKVCPKTSDDLLLS